MIRIRPYNSADADIILSWCRDEKSFYQWSAGVLGDYPITQDDFGFVIVDPERRGQGLGKAMLRQGLKFAFELYGADKVSLGVFENNPSAYYCYKAVGFKDTVLDSTEVYNIMGEEWKCRELIYRNNS